MSIEFARTSFESTDKEMSPHQSRISLYKAVINTFNARGKFTRNFRRNPKIIVMDTHEGLVKIKPTQLPEIETPIKNYWGKFKNIFSGE